MTIPYTQQGSKLVPSEAFVRHLSPPFYSGSQVGYGAAISEDGLTVIFGGATYDASPGSDKTKGAAWVYVSDGAGGWTREAMLTPASASACARFGYSVALSEDGNTAVVGGLGDGATSNSAIIDFSHDHAFGSAWVFVRTFPGGTPTWTEQQKLSQHGSARTRFGNAVIVKGDRAVIADYVNVVSTTPDQRGTVYVYDRSGSTWTLSATLLPSDPASPSTEFGSGISFAGSEDEIVIGASSDATAGSPAHGKGAVFSFLLVSGTWTQQGSKITMASSTDGRQFGYSVSASANTLVVGGAQNATDPYEAWIYTGDITGWTLDTSIGSPLAADDYVRVAVDSTGTVALLGPGDSLDPPSIPSDVGGCQLWKATAGVWAQVDTGQFLPSDYSGTGAPAFGFGMGFGDAGNVFVVSGPGDNASKGAGWVYARPVDHTGASSSTWMFNATTTALTGLLEYWGGIYQT